MFGHYIERRGLEALRNYQYRSAGYTVIDKLFNHWWDLAVKLVPVWVAPNVLTLIGFFSALFAFVLILIYSPTLSEPGPRWMYICIAVLIFLYQTFDALDGKQARRTGTSSPLGQLFDHGCDVMLVTAASITTLGITCSGVGLKQYVVVAVSTQVHQFIYMWWEYHYHVFYCSTGPIGVTEAQLGMIFCSLGAAVFGPEMFGFDLVSLVPEWLSSSLRTPQTLQVREALMYWLIIMNSCVAVYDIVLGIYKARSKRVAGGQMVSFMLFQLIQWLFYKKCLMTDGDVSSYVVYFVMSATYSILVVRLCLSSTCKVHFNTMQWPLLPFCAAVALLHCPSLMESSFYGLAKSKTLLLVALVMWNAVYLTDLLVTSVVDICRYLSIPCFVIPPASRKTQ